MEAIFEGLFELVLEIVFELLSGILEICGDLTLNFLNEGTRPPKFSFSGEIISLNILDQTKENF